MHSVLVIMNPAVVVSKTEPVRNVVKMLNRRYEDWWVLDRIVPRADADIYYFKNIYEEPEPTANAIPINT